MPQGASARIKTAALVERQLAFEFGGLLSLSLSLCGGQVGVERDALFPGVEDCDKTIGLGLRPQFFEPLAEGGLFSLIVLVGGQRTFLMAWMMCQP
jgi:hypothetical protein